VSGTPIVRRRPDHASALGGPVACGGERPCWPIDKQRRSRDSRMCQHA